MPLTSKNLRFMDIKKEYIIYIIVNSVVHCEGTEEEMCSPGTAFRMLGFRLAGDFS